MPAVARMLLPLLAFAAVESCASLIYYTPGQAHNISFDQRSPKINGVPALLMSGAVHYTRVHEGEWERVFDLAIEMGLNTIQTVRLFFFSSVAYLNHRSNSWPQYVFWNAHETYESQVGNASWDGRANLSGFIDAAAARGLWMSVRIGPYICGEYYFGGIPVWMRESGAECFRCDDPIWEREMERWVKLVVQKIAPQIAPKGNVLMLQIENEYGGPAGSKGGDYPPGSHEAKYLGWAVDMVRRC
jgi:beta-galactosidase GanA